MQSKHCNTLKAEPPRNSGCSTAIKLTALTVCPLLNGAMLKHHAHLYTGRGALVVSPGSRVLQYPIWEGSTELNSIPQADLGTKPGHVQPEAQATGKSAGKPHDGSLTAEHLADIGSSLAPSGLTICAWQHGVQLLICELLVPLLNLPHPAHLLELLC